MNQILYNKDDTNKTDNTNYNTFIDTNKTIIKNRFFKFQFTISSILILTIIISYLIYSNYKQSKESISQKIVNSYNISRLYGNSLSTDTSNTYEENGTSFTVIGIIEIPKINISYPILSESSDELLKIAPCRISGPLPNENGNLCIAGHNYENYKFFSKISYLSQGDEIIIYNTQDGSKLSYFVFDIYEVSENNLSPLELSDNIEKQITLITCNNLNSSNRIIIKASP